MVRTSPLKTCPVARTTSVVYPVCDRVGLVFLVAVISSGLKAEFPCCFPPPFISLTFYWTTLAIREVPRSADYEYEYVWVSRILTRWLSVPRRRCWQNEYEYEYKVVGRVKLAVDLPRPLSRTLRVCRPTAVVYEYTLRLSSRHFFTAVKLIRKVRR